MKRLILISASVLIASTSFAQSKCVTAPVTLTGSQVTLTSGGSKYTTNDQVYIYYCRKHHKRHEQPYAVAGINEKYPSWPLLVNSNKDVTALPETYNVTLTTPSNTVSVCPDSTLELTANINVEKTSSYTGNYPNSNSDSKVYKKVSKREFKMAARKMRKIKRQEAKIARRTGMKVEVREPKA